MNQQIKFRFGHKKVSIYEKLNLEFVSTGWFNLSLPMDLRIVTLNPLAQNKAFCLFSFECNCQGELNEIRRPPGMELSYAPAIKRRGVVHPKIDGLTTCKRI